MFMYSAESANISQEASEQKQSTDNMTTKEEWREMGNRLKDKWQRTANPGLAETEITMVEEEDQ